MRELIIKKCQECGATVKVITDCNCNDCGLMCCGKPMRELKANSTDGAIEKHKPSYTIKDNKLMVSVDHVMEEEHYIEWLAIVSDDKEEYCYLNPDDEPFAIFKNTKNAKLYAYCNKHGLWETEIE